MKPAENNVPSTRNFKDFIDTNPTIKHSNPDLAEAMRVGDYIEISMGCFLSWHGKIMPETTNLKALSYRYNIATILEEENKKYTEIVKVCIISISQDKKWITLRANGVIKRVYSSTFYNRYANNDPTFEYFSTRKHLNWNHE